MTKALALLLVSVLVAWWGFLAWVGWQAFRV